MAASCIGVNLGGRLHFDLKAVNQTASGFSYNFTIFSSDKGGSYTYSISIFVFAFDLGVNLPLILVEGVNLSSQSIGNFNIHSDSVSAAGVTLSIDLPRAISVASIVIPYIQAVFTNNSNPTLNLAGTLRPLPADPTISTCLLLSNLASNETRVRITYMIIDNSSLFTSNNVVAKSFFAGTDATGIATFPTIDSTIYRVVLGLREYWSSSAPWSCTFSPVFCQKALAPRMSMVVLSFDQLVCPGNSSRGNIGCNCELGFYESGITSCSACGIGCQVCINSTSCLTCNSLTFRQLVNGSCMCDIGYFEQSPSSSLCGECSINCTVCTSPILCTTCSYQNILTERNECVPNAHPSFTLSKHSIVLNTLTLRLQFSEPIIYVGVGEALSSVVATLNGTPVNI